MKTELGKQLVTGKRDYIVDSHYRADIKQDGNIDWVENDKPRAIANCSGHILGIDFYEPIPNTDGKFIRVELSAHDIKKLHKRILEIEAMKAEQIQD